MRDSNSEADFQNGFKSAFSKFVHSFVRSAIYLFLRQGLTLWFRIILDLILLPQPRGSWNHLARLFLNAAPERG